MATSRRLRESLTSNHTLNEVPGQLSEVVMGGTILLMTGLYSRLGLETQISSPDTMAMVVKEEEILELTVMG